MNRICQSIWNDKSGTFVAASENTKSNGKQSSPGATAVAGAVRFALKGLAVSLMLAFGSNVYALPTGGAVSAGSANIAGGAGKTTINQSSQNVALNWQSFSIGPGEAVQFVQPNSSSVALNRVLGADASSILGALSANGKVFLLNPNGILFGQGAQVNVGGLVASTLGISDSDFMAGRYNFAGAGNGTILNQGSINADGGFVALLGANVSNEGVISARLGTVALAAGNAITLDVAGDGLLNVTVNQGVANSLVQNGGLIQADGGQVLLTAQAAGTLLQSAVNNTGVIQAQSVENHNGTIRLMGDMQSGTVNMSGKLDASAPNGGDGGFIETSAAHVKVADNAIVTTQSSQGKSGTWLIDPQDFTISAAAAGTIAGGNPSGDVSGSTLTTALGSGNVTILSSQGSTAGSGDINVNDAVNWSSNALTLTAARDININAVMTASGTSVLVMNTATANGSDAAVAGGAVKVGLKSGGFTGRVDFPSRRGVGILTINGLGYTVVDTLGASTTTTVTDLQGMKSGLASNYALGTNIDATGTDLWNAGVGFVPIGIPGNPFMGRFDGLGHTITALTVKPGSASAGLFGATGPNLSFQNVGLVGGSVVGAAGSGGLIGTNGTGSTVSNSYNTGSVTGAAGTGGLVGDTTTGAINNSYATGNVNGAAGTGGLVGTNTTGAISNSYATGIVVGSGAGTGGLVGSNTTGTVSKSYASGSVTGAGAATGGLLGSNGAAAVSDSYATGNVIGSGAGVGGLMGVNGAGTVTTSYAAGSVSLSGIGSGPGGLVGTTVTGTVTDSFWDQTTTGQPASAGGGLAMTTTAQMKTQANFTSATAVNGNVNPNWDFSNTWVMYNGLTYPLLRPFMTPLTVTANNATKTYDQLAYSGSGGVTYSATPNANLLGTLSYTGGINVGGYTITPSGLYSNQQGYIISYANGALTITAKALSMSGLSVPASKIYDANLVAVVSGTPTLAAAEASGTGTTADGKAYTGDIVAITGTATGTYNFKDVAGATPGTTVTFGGLALNNTNYSLTIQAADPATITAKGLTATIAAPDKVYDGNTTAAPTFTIIAAGLVGTETVTATGAATFNTKDVLTATTVTANSNVLANGANGGLASNYSLGIGQTDASVITAKGLTATIAAPDKVYDGNTTAAPTFTIIAAGLVGTETVTATGAATFNTKDVLTATTVTANSNVLANGANGGLASNYSLGIGQTDASVITTAPLGIAANAAAKTYDGLAYSGGNGVVYSGFVNSETSAVLGGTLAYGGTSQGAVNAGNYVIAPSGLTSGNYTISYVDGTLGVTRAVLGIAANAAAKSYDGLAYSGGNGVIYSGFVNSETSAVLGGALAYGGTSQAAVNVGNYLITPSGLTSGNYTISYVDGTLGVIPAGLLGIAANAAAKTYDGLAYSGGNGVTYTGFQGTDTAASLAGMLAYGGSSQGAVNVGSYTIIPSGQSSPNYTIVYVNGTLGVIPAPLGIAANSAIRLYGNANPAFSAIYTGFRNGETTAALTGALALATPAVPASNVGNYAITPSGQSSTNYTITYVDGAMGVTPAPLGIAANSATRLYGDANPAFSAAYTGFKNGETAAALTGALALATPAVASSTVGNHAITPSGQSSTNYTITYVNGKLGVTSAPLGIVANSTSKTYGSTVSFAGTEFSSTGLKNGETIGSASLASAGAAATAAVAGSPYAITPSSATGGTFTPSNYTISYVNGVLGVIPASLGIVANSTSKTYGSTVSFAGTEFSSTGLKNGETVGSVSLASAGEAATAGVAGSPYDITPSAATGGSFNASNYTIGYTNGVLAVNPAALTVAANAAAKTYDGMTYSGGNGVVYTGFVNGETAAVLGGALAYGGTSQGAIKAGNYLITPKGLTSGNYAIGYTNGTLAVNPAPLTVTATGTNKVYDGTTLDAVTLADNRIPGDVLTITNAAANFADKNVGNGKAVNVSGISVTGTDAGNYTFNTTAATTVNITQASLTVTVNDIAKAAGTPNPTFSASYSGLVTGDTPSALTGLLAFSTPATNLSPIGAYPIIPSGQSAVNYTITYANGALAVIAVVVPPVIEPSVVVPPVVMPDETQPVQNFVDSTSGGMAGLNLTVIGAGVRMPPVQLAEAPPDQPAPVATPPVVPPMIYVPPERPRKSDRN